MELRIKWNSHLGHPYHHGQDEFRWWTRIIVETVFFTEAAHKLSEIILSLLTLVAYFVDFFATVTKYLMTNLWIVTDITYIAWVYLFFDLNLKVVLKDISHNDGFELFLTVWAAIFTFVGPGLYAFKAKFVVAAVNPCFCRMLDFFNANSAGFFFFVATGSHQVFGNLTPKQLFFSRNFSLAWAYRFSIFWLSFSKSCGFRPFLWLHIWLNIFIHELFFLSRQFNLFLRHCVNRFLWWHYLLSNLNLL